jgi:hypothetical protein
VRHEREGGGPVEARADLAVGQGAREAHPARRDGVREAAQPEFRDYAAQIVRNARALAEALAGHGFRLVSGGTDNHLLLVDLRSFDAELTGKTAALWLEQVGIIANMNTESLQRERQYLTENRILVMDDGSIIPVILDDAMDRVTIDNQIYESDIYVVATDWGGQPLVYYEFFDMGNPQATEAVNATGAASDTVVINNGMYRVFRMNQGGCYQYKFVARPRLILDAPFVHGRLDNVRYTGYAGARDPIPGMSNYVNGGISYRS